MGAYSDLEGIVDAINQTDHRHSMAELDKLFCSARNIVRSRKGSLWTAASNGAKAGRGYLLQAFETGNEDIYFNAKRAYETAGAAALRLQEYHSAITLLENARGAAELTEDKTEMAFTELRLSESHLLYADTLYDRNDQQARTQHIEAMNYLESSMKRADVIKNPSEMPSSYHSFLDYVLNKLEKVNRKGFPEGLPEEYKAFMNLDAARSHAREAAKELRKSPESANQYMKDAYRQMHDAQRTAITANGGIPHKNLLQLATTHLVQMIRGISEQVLSNPQSMRYVS